VKSQARYSRGGGAGIGQWPTGFPFHAAPKSGSRTVALSLSGSTGEFNRPPAHLPHDAAAPAAL